MRNLKFLILGIIFGIVLTKSEVISWFRIQEMFRFEAIHMYGIIGLAVIIGAISIQLIKKYELKTFYGEGISFEYKPFHKGAVYGGLIFGCGWALTGACPGPLFALVGNGYSIILVSLISALSGTWVYGFYQNRLPH